MAACEQIGDPATAKGPVERKVVRIVTPGTMADSQVLPDRDDRILLTVCWLGELTPDDLSREVDRLRPAELVLSEDAKLPEALTDSLAGVALVRAPGCQFDPVRGQRRQTELLGTRDLSGFGALGLDAAVGAAGALLDYLE